MTRVISHDSDLEFELSVAHCLCCDIDTPRAIAVDMLAQAGEWQQLVDLEINPEHYEDPGAFADDALVTQVLKKSIKVPLGVDRDAVALEGFKADEVRNSLTNELWKHGPPVEIWDEVKVMKQFIARVLGPLTPSTLEKIQGKMRHGPGATTGVRGTGSALSQKYDAPLHLYDTMYPFYRSLLGDTWWQHQRRPVVVDGNKMSFVLKDAKKSRVICSEATLAVYCQLGIGDYMKDRLKTFGVNLRDQSRNQFLAEMAIFLELATIDLRSASNNVCHNPVYWLLEWDWFELLSTFRAPQTKLPDGTWHQLEMFSSMGNGYTFELESLIFRAAIEAVVPLAEQTYIGVFGDDLIVPRMYVQRLVDLLEALGFLVNEQKSFLAGSFFESCGTDWFNACPVRPFYLRRSLDDAEKRIPYSLQIANALRLWATRRRSIDSCDLQADDRFRNTWKALVRTLPDTWKKCRGPASLGDSCIISSTEEILASAHRVPMKPRSAEDKTLIPSGEEGVMVRHVTMRPKKTVRFTTGRLLVALTAVGGPLENFYNGPADPGLATRGKEPRRGLFGNPRPGWTLVVLGPEEEMRWSAG